MTRVLPRRLRRALTCAIFLAGACVPAMAGESDRPAQALLATYQRMIPQLERSAFGRPLLLDSVETPDGLQGEIHAVLGHSLADLRAALMDPQRWCELLRLHINNRRCRVSQPREGGGDLLTLAVVRRYDQPVEDAFELPFVYRVESASAGLLAVDMSAASGPLGTSNYRVTLDAIALGNRRTFVRFSYAYENNAMARLATQAYLATFGSHKAGFTVVGKEADGRPKHIDGLRGMVERNAMRYFLALDAHLAAAASPATARFERRLAHWFAAIEKHPRQLHEVDLATYLELKRSDRRRDAPNAR